MGLDRPRVFLIILDGVGIGAAPDASLYGDEGSDTLGNLARLQSGLHLPELQKLGLGNISSLAGVPGVTEPKASYGKMTPQSVGKDSISGHWEICGIRLDIPFPTYPNGFPAEVVDLVEEVCGAAILGNEVASGTEIMARLGGEHLRTGRLILYTSADSVLQLLAHEDIIPLDQLYRICEEIHTRLVPPHRVARIIARPFMGKEGAFQRTSNRKDFALAPPAVTILDLIHDNGYTVIGIGKVDTLFAGRGFSQAIHTKSNREGISRIQEMIKLFSCGLVFANLIDFDMLWGHRNDPIGFQRGLEELDRYLPDWLTYARDDDLFILTADHGNDPTTVSTDHTREYVPLLAWRGRGGQGNNLGIRDSFCDVAATLAEFFGIAWNRLGRSFLVQAS